MKNDLQAVRRWLRLHVVAIFLLSALPAALAFAGQWCATSECPGCAAHGYGSGHGKECFASRESCEARLREVLGVSHNGVTYSACSEEGGSSSGGGDLDALRAQSQAAAPGHQMDPYINEAISRGVSGDISAGDAMGLVGMGVLGNALLGQQDPAARAARQAAEQAAAAERARQQAIEEEERKNRLLSGMLDVEGGADQAVPAAGAPTADNPLGLMLDDNVGSASAAAGSGEQGFMPNRTPRRQANPQPPATRVNQGPYVTPNPLGLMMDDPAPPPAAPQPPPPPAGNPAMVAGAFNEGFVKGSQCYSNSAGAYCSAAGTDMQNCVNNYQAGYQNGEVLKRLQLQQARAAGAADRPGGRNNSFGSPSTQGPCRLQLIDAYNEGFR